MTGTQISRTGRKGSAATALNGGSHLDADDLDGWETVGPTSDAFDPDGTRLWKAPRALSVGGITDAAQADGLVRASKADIVLLGRALIRDPHWAFNAAKKLGVDARHVLAEQYGFFVGALSQATGHLDHIGFAKDPHQGRTTPHPNCFARTQGAASPLEPPRKPVIS